MASDLKTQFLNYMTVQRFSHHTKRSYVTGVKLLTKHYMQSPDTLTNDQIQDYIRCLLSVFPSIGTTLLFDVLKTDLIQFRKQFSSSSADTAIKNRRKV